MSLYGFLFVAFLIAAVSSLLGGYVAGEKRRSPNEGFLLGFLFGPFGVLLVALLPEGRPAPARPAPKRTPTPSLLDDEVPDSLPWLNAAEARARRN